MLSLMRVEDECAVEVAHVPLIAQYYPLQQFCACACRDEPHYGGVALSLIPKIPLKKLQLTMPFDYPLFGKLS